MNRRFLPLLSIAAVAALAAPLSVLGGSSAAQPPERGPVPRTLSVTGDGLAAAAPDLATLSIGVESEGKTAAEAVRLMSQRMTATMQRLKSSGVAERDMQTSGLSVNARYNYENQKTPQIIGYVATNMVTVKLRDLAKAGAVIDAAVQDGANQLNGLSFGFADPKPLENKARAAAVADAREKAATLAKAAGVSLGPILLIQDGFSAGPPMPMVQGRAMAAEAKSVPVAAGESTIAATVTLVYEIR